MKKRLDAIKLKRSDQSANDDDKNDKENENDHDLLKILVKSQQTTNKLLESLMYGQKEILASLQDSQSLLGKVVRI